MRFVIRDMTWWFVTGITRTVPESQWGKAGGLFDAMEQVVGEQFDSLCCEVEADQHVVSDCPEHVIVALCEVVQHLFFMR